jgi:hypothetical protein
MNQSEAILTGNHQVQREQNGGRAIKGQCLQQRHGAVDAEDPAWREVNPEGLPNATRHVEIRGNLQAPLSQCAANRSESLIERLPHDEGYGFLLSGHWGSFLPFTH